MFKNSVDTNAGITLISARQGHHHPAHILVRRWLIKKKEKKPVGETLVVSFEFLIKFCSKKKRCLNFLCCMFQIMDEVKTPVQNAC